MTTPTVEENLSIEVVIAQTPTVALMDPKKKEELYAFLEREIEVFVPDLSTEASRKRIAALAYKVARTKSAIDEAGKELNEKLRKQINAVDASRREIREKLDALKEKARKPLTDWEEVEAKRLEFCQSQIKMLEAAPQILATDTSESVASLLKAVEDTEIDQAVFQEFYAAAVSAKKVAIASLQTAIEVLKKKEAEAIELVRLRAESEARQAADREAARIAEEKRLKEERTRQAEERKAAEAAAAAKAAQEAEDRVKRESEAAAQKERERLEREHQSALEAQKKERLEAERIAREEALKVERELKAQLEQERKLKEAAEKKHQAEAARIAKEEAARKEEADRVKAEANKKAAAEKKLTANKTHRQVVMTAAKAALMEHAGLEEETARKVVLAISTEKIPAVSMRFA